MNISDETLMLYVDGELDAPTRAAVESAAAADLALAARVAALRGQSERLRRAYASTLEESVPERLRSVVIPTVSPPQGTVVDLAPRRAARSIRERLNRWAWPEWAAIAASLLLGAVVMQLQAYHNQGGQLRAAADGLVAGPALARVLSSQLASTQESDSVIRVGPSFQNRSGQLCRTFAARSVRPWSGLACFSEGDWRLGMTMENPGANGRGSPDRMRMAASEFPPEILRAAAEQMLGEPLDGAAERTARDRGWRP